jgi:hypothetical protein
MMSAAKQTGKRKPSMRSPLAASPKPIGLPEGMWERISQKAFELWQDRGYREGHDRGLARCRAIVMEEIVKLAVKRQPASGCLLSFARALLARLESLSSRG